MNHLVLRLAASLAPFILVWALALSASAQTPDTARTSSMRFGYGPGGPPITCPQSDQWLLAYWMGQPPQGVPVLSAHQMCPNVDRFWVNVNGRWSGYSPALPDLANDPFDPPVGAAVFLHGERIVSTPVPNGSGLPFDGGEGRPAPGGPVVGVPPIDITGPLPGTGATSGLAEYLLALTRLLPRASDALNEVGALASNPQPDDEQWRADVRLANVELRAALAAFRNLNPPQCLETAHLLLIQTIETQITYSLLMDAALAALDLGDPVEALGSYESALAGLRGGSALLIRATDALRASQCPADTAASAGATPVAPAATGTVQPARTATPTPTPTTTVSAVRPDARGCPASHPVKAVRQTGLYYPPGSASYGTVVADLCFATASDAQAAGFRLAG